MKLENIKGAVNQNYTLRFMVKRDILRKLPTFFYCDFEITNIEEREP